MIAALTQRVLCTSAALACIATIASADCFEDLTGDGNVGGADLGTLLAAWGECADPDNCPEDLTGDGNVGGADLGTLLAAWGECPDEFCPPDALDEGEPCGESLTGGCNMDTPMFGPKLQCGDSVCGTAWAELQDPGDPDSGMRDTDWYPFTINDEQSEVTWSVEAEFEAVASIVGGDCDDPEVILSDVGEQAGGTTCLPPGDYWLFIAPASFEGLPCDGESNRYVATLEMCEPDPDGEGLCESPGCDVCPADATDEGEPCGEDHNGGCNSDDNLFSSISCGETICGTSWAKNNTRDMDWFLFEVTEAGAYTAKLKSQFPGHVILAEVDLSDPDSPACTAVSEIAYSDDECSVGIATAELEPGTYAVFVSMGQENGVGIFDGYPCDSGENEYSVTLFCE